MADKTKKADKTKNKSKKTGESKKAAQTKNITPESNGSAPAVRENRATVIGCGSVAMASTLALLQSQLVRELYFN